MHPNRRRSTARAIAIAKTEDAGRQTLILAVSVTMAAATGLAFLVHAFSLI
ncbi:hypothetical protein [Xaviernesmea oryzae]|uniref:hypothetical protein n=1 Tax=Xaviernesmea oryzae TaxID=464029 RepID=UPI001481936B|nr:hypothetical protein [Xaviernesmea oryzae]